MSPSGFGFFLDGMPWFAWVAIEAIICGAISKVVLPVPGAFERMEMIRQGMRPSDYKSTMPEI